jgi:CRISPR-associated protein Cas4
LKIKHTTSSKRYLQGTSVYCDKYGIAGKIDIYDKKEKSLIERKNKVKVIYPGYKYQLYAEMFCMQEMGYEVKKLFIHSLTDNKRYKIQTPTKQELINFEETIKEIQNFTPEKIISHTCANCQNNIYSALAWN